jgi:hypothetical protein
MASISLTELWDGAPHGMQSIVGDRALNGTQSIDKVTGQGPTRHQSLVHVTTHIKAIIVALLVALYSQYVHINVNDITGQKI